MGGPRLDYFALRPMDIGGTVYAVGDVVDVTAMSNDTVTGLVRSGWLATSLAGDIRSAVVQATEPAGPQTNDLWIDSDAVSVGDAAEDRIGTVESTTSAPWVDLATVGPEVTIDTGTRVLVVVTGIGRVSNNGDIGWMAFEVSGATSRTPDTLEALRWSVANAVGMSRVHLITGLTAGSNTFTAKYGNSSTTTLTCWNRAITVMTL